MAGLRMSVTVSVTAFLLGLLFTHWTADSLTLWKTPSSHTDARLWTAATYYSILGRMPSTLLYVYGSVALLGATTLLWSLGDGRAGNFMFDGGSLLLYTSAAMMYIFSVLPNILENFKPLPLPFISSLNTAAKELPPFPVTLKTPTLELASSHLVCSVALTGVLVLQAGRWWAEQRDRDGDDEAQPEQMNDEKTKSDAVPVVVASKKDS
ncbi:hypothetical protein BDW22DRAFT_1426865 [Trametopsis cervina]|nr:hypothetical protein BDW22DRAFT_1426865 [Trametopsis cervina]